MQTEDKVAEIIARVLNVDPVRIREAGSDHPLNGIGMDSLNCVDIVLTFEETFDVAFNDEELLLDKLNTIRKLVSIIEQKQGKHSVA